MPEGPAATPFKPAAQPWLSTIPIMQQSVLFSAIRGPDGFAKGHPAKGLIRWYRRCVLLSAFDGAALTNPFTPGGGDFTGTPYPYATIPADNDWPLHMRGAVNDFLRARDEMALHYFAHAMHAFQILGAHHPDLLIRAFWQGVYLRMVDALHLVPEPEALLDRRLGDDEPNWRDRSDAAGSCST